MSMNGHFRGQIALVVIATAACQPKDDRPQEFQVRDSAGISIATNRGSVEATVPPLWVSDGPTVRIESHPEDSDLVLHRIRGTVRLSDGRIALVSEGTKELRFYSPDGVHLQTVGREGDGPGEFRAPYFLYRFAGDSLGVTERGGRLSWFGPDGSFLGRAQSSPDQAQRVVPAGYHAAPTVRLVGRDGGLAFVTEAEFGPPGERWRPRRGFVLTGPDPGLPRFLGWYRSVEHFYLPTQRADIAMFANDTYVAMDHLRGRVFIGDSEEFEIHVFDDSGSLSWIIRDEEPAGPITSEDIEWERWSFLSWGEAVGMAREYKQIVDATPIPDQKPAFESLVVDSRGWLWAKEYASHRPHLVRWWVYDTDGRRIGAVRLPGRLTVYDIGEDYVLGVAKDLLDVESVLLFDLRRPGS